MNKIAFRNKDGFPPTICIQLLNWCNLSCTNCRSSSSPHGKEHLSYDAIATLLENLSKYGKWRISLTGGEPFFWKDLPRLLTLIYKLNYPFSITTNGYASHNMFDSIPKQYWNNGTLYVSIDGNKTVHNILRGNNSFERATSFISYTRPKAKTIFVNTVLFTDPKYWMKELYAELMRLKVDNWTIISPVSKGRLEREIFTSKSFEEYYSTIREYTEKQPHKKPTTSYLSFAEKENTVNDVVFINSNGDIRLPGIDYDSTSNDFEISSSIYDPKADKIIFDSVNFFLSETGYML